MLTINFGLWIQDYDIDSLLKLSGPVFNRWLPEGEKDALKIILDEYDSEVYLWFERHGYVNDSGFIEYKHKTFEVDPLVMTRQAKLYAGALYGKLLLKKVSQEQLTALINCETENDEYIRLGKFVIKKILDPILVRFTRLIKNTYGQYWIEVFEPYDSRKLALANHCLSLNMKWRINESSGKFVPGMERPQAFSVRSQFCVGENYISKEDWQKIGVLMNGQFEPSISSAIASRANRLLVEEQFAYSLIEAVTAIELALEEYVRKSMQDKSMLDCIKSFWQTPLPTRISLISALAGVDQKDIRLSLDAVKERNKLVHEGVLPKPSVFELIEGLLRNISFLHSDQQLKFPSGTQSNSLSN